MVPSQSPRTDRQKGDTFAESHCPEPPDGPASRPGKFFTNSLMVQNDLEPIQEVRIQREGAGRVKRLSMRRIMARRMKASTVRA